MMGLFISVVNHHHDDLIIECNTLSKLSNQYEIIIKSNTVPTPALKKYCEESQIHLLTSHKITGFGANNNEVFKFCISQLKMQPDDYFLVLNPDVIISGTEIKSLLKSASDYNADISAINLYRNKTKTEYDNSIRHYHSLLNPLKSLIGLPRHDIYDKSAIKQPIVIDWAAGSFLLFKTRCYQDLNGFDEKYFMYFEDVDICKRANKKGNTVMYFPQIEAIHLAALSNRKLFSKYFILYMRSLIKYHIGI